MHPAHPALLLLLLASCGGGDASSTTASTTTAPPLTGSVTVFAASSLTDAFTEMGWRFEEANPRVKVTFSFAASSTLATQVGQGAPADVLATADEASMEAATATGTTGPPVRFARNVLQIIVTKGSPKALTGIHDLDRVAYVLCDPAVPCGRYAALALERNDVTPRPKSYETNVRNVVARVTSGEADAGIVYHTDVVAQKGAAAGIDIGNSDEPDLQNVYPIAVTRQATNEAGARAWIDYVVSRPGQRVLASYGFLPPRR